MCGCAHRRAAFGVALDALRHGDVAAARAATDGVAASLIADGRAVAAQAATKLAAAHARLARR